MLLSTCWLGATQTHNGSSRVAAATEEGSPPTLAAVLLARCGAAKACGCRHGRKSLTAGAVETLLEHTPRTNGIGAPTLSADHPKTDIAKTRISAAR